jgi:hypothetical protein
MQQRFVIHSPLFIPLKLRVWFINQRQISSTTIELLYTYTATAPYHTYGGLLRNYIDSFII